MDTVVKPRDDTEVKRIHTTTPTLESQGVIKFSAFQI
ncbi:MAG: hypothetical protein LN560_02865 [Rickettsia endosymbiont of Sceptobius lativentris]|nr:hypothetical protein [Rickettsia endosymbiont of Sceptobius lativentris]